MATAPRPGADNENKMRALLDAPFQFKVNDALYTMRVGDVDGLTESECVQGGGVPAMACIGMVASEQVTLAVLASLRFYAFRQSGRTDEFKDVLKGTSYRMVLELVSAPDTDVLEQADPDPTTGA